MNFTDLVFFPFVILLVVFVQTVPARLKWIPVLVASLIFYATWSITYWFQLLIVSFVVWGAGSLIENNSKVGFRKIVLYLSSFLLIVGWLRTKVSFDKLGSLDHLLVGGVGRDIQVIYAVGVSFYSLQAFSYLYDVYIGKISGEKNPFKVMSYLSFFPQLLAGPIEKYEDLAPQLKSPKKVDVNWLCEGIYMIATGLFYKLVLGDNISRVSETLNSSMVTYSIYSYLIGSFAFWFQIYFDFNGYTKIALGCAKILGIELTENFNSPFKASNIIDYWRRWHITFYSWLRSYFYFPIIANKSLRKWPVLIVFFLFVVSGLWHGLSLNYLLWGAYNGLLIAFFALTDRWFTGKSKLSQSLYLFYSKVYLFIGVGLSWILFNTKTQLQLNNLIETALSKRPLQLDVQNFFEILDKKDSYLIAIILLFVVKEFVGVKVKKIESWKFLLLSIFFGLLILIFGRFTANFIYFGF